MAQCGFVLGLRAAKETVSLVPAWLRADSATNLIKQGGNCNGLTMWLGSSAVRVLAQYLTRAVVVFRKVVRPMNAIGVP